MAGLDPAIQAATHPKAIAATSFNHSADQLGWPGQARP